MDWRCGSSSRVPAWHLENTNPRPTKIIIIIIIIIITIITIIK
jgi:hypothetical protein